MANSTSRVRGMLVGILFVLACLGVVLSTIAVWAHQTVLATDRFTAAVERIVAEPAVQEAAADRLATQVVVAADVQGRVAGVLPPQQAFLAVPLANAVETFLDRRLTTLFATERVQQALVNATGFAHEQFIRLMRSESDVVQLQGNALTIDLLPIAVEGLRLLQDHGLLTGVTLPDVTDPNERTAAIADLEARLGRDLPDDFATLPVAETAGLARVQALIRAFDIVTIVIVIVTILLLLATVWFARRRLRMVTALALGIVFSLAVARLLVRGAVDGITASLAADGRAVVLDEIVRALTVDLQAFSWILIIIGILVAVTAWAVGGPRETTSGGAAVSASGEDGQGVEAWIRRHATGLTWLAAGALIVAVLWLATGPELAIIAGVAVVALYASGVLRGKDDEALEEVASAPG